MRFVQHINELTQQPVGQIIRGLGMKRARYYHWINRRKNDRLKDHKPIGRNPDTLLPEERQKIIDYYQQERDHYTGYARLCYEMIDKDLVYASPSTVYRVLSDAGLLMPWASAKQMGEAPEKPEKANEKWHTDLMQINYQGHIFYYQGVIDAFSRTIIAHDVHTEATSLNASLVLQSAFDKSPVGITPFIVADNGSEFIGKEFREVIRANDGKRMKITAYHPQSNGIDERHHRTLREECFHGTSPENLLVIKKMVREWVDYYNNQRLHSAIWYMPPAIWHYGKQHELLKVRQSKLTEARKMRRMINHNNPKLCDVLNEAIV